MNKIVTRGFGPSRGFAGQAGLVTMGYGGTPRFVIEAIQQGIEIRRHYGQSGFKRRLNDELQLVVVWAKLLEINGEVPKRTIEGTTRVPIKKNRITTIVEHISTSVRQAYKDIKITVKRLK